jgi:hypothetical protein
MWNPLSLTAAKLGIPSDLDMPFASIRDVALSLMWRRMMRRIAAGIPVRPSDVHHV